MHFCLRFLILIDEISYFLGWWGNYESQLAPAKERWRYTFPAIRVSGLLDSYKCATRKSNRSVYLSLWPAVKLRIGTEECHIPGSLHPVGRELSSQGSRLSLLPDSFQERQFPAPQKHCLEKILASWGFFIWGILPTLGEGQLCRRCRTGLLPPELFPFGSNAAVSLILGTRGARVTPFTGGPRSHSQKP